MKNYMMLWLFLCLTVFSITACSGSSGSGGTTANPVENQGSHTDSGNDNETDENEDYPGEQGGSDNTGSGENTTGDSDSSDADSDNSGNSGNTMVVKFIEAGNWNGGFNGTIRIENSTVNPVDGWELAFNTSFDITSVWNASWSHDNGAHTITNDTWNNSIQPSGFVEIGFGANGQFRKENITDFGFNGNNIDIIVIPWAGGSTGNGTGISGIRLKDVDPQYGFLNQITVDQGLNSFPIIIEGNDAPDYTLSTNNKTVINFSITQGNKLNVTGLKSGRASLKIEEKASGAVRYVGIRVRTGSGELPGLPEYLSVGSVSEDSTADLNFWKDFSPDLTNKRMDIRYIYLNGGPYNGWTTWNGTVNQTGGRAISYIRESLKLGMIPSFVYYNIPDGGESYYTNSQHMQDAQYMEDYFKDLQIALDIINDEAGDETVVMILEPDFLGYLAQNNDNPSIMEAKTDSVYKAGVLSGSDPVFPNTVKGLVETINYIISTKAPNVVFGWQMNLWASPAGGFTTPIPGNGLIHLTDTMGITNGRSAIYNEASAITEYYVKAGILSHGADFVSIDKYGLDAVGSQSSSKNDPENSYWFWNNDHWNNYLAFVKAMNDTSGLPVILWQIPVGHINHSLADNPYNGGLFPDLNNTSKHYEDSSPVFFLGDTFEPGAGNRFGHFSGNEGNDPKLSVSGGEVTWESHMQETADAGVISVLFGAGVGDSTDGVGSDPTDDYWWITKVQEYYGNPVLLK